MGHFTFGHLAGGGAVDPPYVTPNCTASGGGSGGSNCLAKFPFFKVAKCIFIILEFSENFHLKMSCKFHGIFKFSGCFYTLDENFHKNLKISSENFKLKFFFKFSGTMLLQSAAW